MRFCTLAVNKLGATQKHSYFHSHNYTVVISESHPRVKHYFSQTWQCTQREKSRLNVEKSSKGVPSWPGFRRLVYLLCSAHSCQRKCSLGLRRALGSLRMAGEAASWQAKITQDNLQISSSTALWMDCLSTCVYKQRLMMTEETKTSKTKKKNKIHLHFP